MPSLEIQRTAPGWILDEAVGPDTKLRQVDLVRFENNESALRRVGIIVTADCDLEQKKHARLVTIIPVVTAQVILEQYLLIEDCERKCSLIEDYLFNECSIDKRQDRETKFSVLRGIARNGLLDGNEVAAAAAKFVLGGSDSIPITLYKKLMKAINNVPKKADALRDQIRGRGDLLILPNTERLGVDGYIAWVRHIWQAPLGDIAIRTSEVNSRSGERIARLDSPYRYRLTQLMAQVFSDIGLPNTPDNVDQVVKDVYVDA